VLAGQSNAGGHGYVSREFAWFSPQGDDCLVELGKTAWLAAQPDTLFNHWRGGTPTAARPVLWDARSDGWIPLRAGYSLFGYNATAPSQLGAETINHPFGAEVTFAERIRAARTGRNVAMIKYTQGGTGLGTAAAPGAWDPAAGRTYNIGSFANAGHCYRGLLDLVRDSLGELERQGHEVELRGMLWHQGENDSGLGTTVYKERLLGFIAAIREDLGNPELPFVIGELIQSQSGYAAVRAAQKQAAAETPRTAFVSAVGLQGDSTAIHFDTTGQMELGRRYAEAMLRFGPAMRRTIARWRLDETTLAWRGTFAPVTDAVTGTEGVLYGYAETDNAAVTGAVINRDGPDGGTDRAFDFAPDAGISGVNTNRPDALPATGDFSLLVWMKTTDPYAAQGHLFSNNNGQAARANLMVIGGALSWFHHGGLTLSEPASPIFDGAWHRVGVMRKGNEWFLLRDGQRVANGQSAAAIGQDTEWMIGRMRAYNGNFEGLIGDVVVLNHAADEPFRIESSGFIPGGDCVLSWTSQPGFEYGLEWSPDLTVWNLLGIVPATGGQRTSHAFPDPSSGPQLFLRVR
jgi:hypothetical protein